MSLPSKPNQPTPAQLTILLSLHHQLLAFHSALGVGEGQPQPDGHEGPKPTQGVVGGGLDELLCLEFLQVEGVLVVHGEVVAVAASDGVAEGLPLQRQLPRANVHHLHVLGPVHGV